MLTAHFDMTVYCSHPDYRRVPARYKIAAEWTGGDYKEYKTYGFANDDCLLAVYQAAAERAGRFRPCEGETLGDLVIFELDASKHDYELARATEAEKRVTKELAQGRKKS